MLPTHDGPTSHALRSWPCYDNRDLLVTVLLLTLRELPRPQMNPEKRVMLPVAAFRGFVSRFQEPTNEEGFQEILKVDFEVGHTSKDYFALPNAHTQVGPERLEGFDRAANIRATT